MKKFFIFADVHGHYDILTEELKRSGFELRNEEHFVISLGDNFDRGNQNIEVYNFLNQMYEKNRAILICGNHEEMLKKIIANKNITQVDVMNGTAFTIYQVAKFFCGIEAVANVFYYEFEKYTELIKNTNFYKLILKMDNYYETQKYIFTHGYIPVKKENSFFYYLDEWRKCSQSDFDRAKWNDGQKLSINYGIHEPNKKVVVGHIPTLYNNYIKKYGIEIDRYSIDNISQECISLNSGIYETRDLLAIDAYTTKSKRVNILVINEDDM